LTAFQNFVTAVLSKKFAARMLLCFPPHLKHVHKLPVEIQKITNSKNLTQLTK